MENLTGLISNEIYDKHSELWGKVLYYMKVSFNKSVVYSSFYDNEKFSKTRLFFSTVLYKTS